MGITKNIPADIKHFIDDAAKDPNPNYKFLKEQIARCWPKLNADTEYCVRIYLAYMCKRLTLYKMKQIRYRVYYLCQRPVEIQERFKAWRKCNEGTIKQKLEDDNITEDDFYKWIIQKFEADYTNKYFGRAVPHLTKRPNNPNGGSGGGTDIELPLRIIGWRQRER